MHETNKKDQLILNHELETSSETELGVLIWTLYYSLPESVWAKKPSS